MLDFTRSDIRNLAADAATFRRGESYYTQGKVLSCQPSGDEILAVVRGSRDDYQVQLRQTRHGLGGYCSCFMGYNCKHQVAAALYHLDGQKQPAWERWLDTVPTPAGTPTSAQPVLSSSTHHLLYQLKPEGATLRLRFMRAYLRQDGSWSQWQDYHPHPPFKSYMQPAFVSATDLTILPALQHGAHDYRFVGESGYSALLQVLREQRLLCQDLTATRSDARSLSWHWQTSNIGKQLCATLRDTPDWRLLETDPPCFVDLASGCIGTIETPLSGPQIAHLLQAPPLPREAWLETSFKLAKLFTPAQLPPPVELDCVRIERCTPHLHLIRLAYSGTLALPALELTFDYGDFSLAPDYSDTADLQVLCQQDNKNFIIQRDRAAETDIFDQLSALNLRPEARDKHHFFWTINTNSGDELISLWNQTIASVLPNLAEQGWRITVADDFSFQVKQARFSFSLADSTSGWFNLTLDLGLGGQHRLDTGELIRMWLEQGAPEQMILPYQQDWLELDTRSLQQIHSLLKGLILEHDLNQPLKLPLFQAAQLHELPDLNDRAAPLTRALMQQLHDFRGIEPVTPPASLEAELREYQQLGLNWLHFLHRHQFGGILADDMGLGKTLQVLAFIASLKEQHQLQQPALVVAPTSLLGNWQREAARFTPRLRTLVLHGTQRTLDKTLLEQADIILTSYALLHLDGEFHQQQAYALAVLDEAQAIKNPNTKTASSARQLNAGMRLCLSGTPLENHLGELWSLLDFALPGLLYGQSFFNSTLRNPIERNGDAQARQELARKIAPFVLRRTKQQVAAELPEKTLITQYVELGSKQAALYESVRLSMEKHIRELIDKQGLAKSRIEFLDALLKLRQACIAPQLVKLAQAKNIHESAKLGWLADTLPAMLEEGRRVLIFSQFTQALGLVEEVLKKQNIGYSKLTGATRKRQEAIDAFQLGDTPVFLISLKAGGSGLNLTRADTVIHLDPWWNPAVENQATDRAHRIGQDKPVFVYKLVASGTVEERIQQMQEQKQALADALFDSTRSAPKPESAEELLSLLAH